MRPSYRRQPAPGEQGALSRSVLDILRRAEAPMSALALALALVDRIMADRGLDAGDRALVRSMRKRVDMTLRYQRTNGMVREGERVGTEVVWEIA